MHALFDSQRYSCEPDGSRHRSRSGEGRWDKAVCLGDLVGYGPDPNEVIDRVRELDAVTIRGNHDKAVTGLANPEEFNPVAQSPCFGRANSFGRKISNTL